MKLDLKQKLKAKDPCNTKSQDEALKDNKCGFFNELSQEWDDSSKNFPSHLKLDPKIYLLHNFTQAYYIHMGLATYNDKENFRDYWKIN